MKKGFVLGKFLPFHKGHEAMIHFALGNCEELIVLVCCSDIETVSAEIRMNWIKETFHLEIIQDRLKVISYEYLEKDLSSSSVASEEITGKWAIALKGIIPADYSTIISSEGYGKLLAEYMGLQYIMFDYQRHLVPVSATMIRNEIFKYWGSLPESVKPYFSIKVAILGTESTGKTTLAKKLAEQLNGVFIPEAGRRLIPTSKSFTEEDLHKVAKEHAYDIQFAITHGDSPLLIMDTDINITQSYGWYTFRKQLQFAHELYEANKADLYIYLDKGVPFVQDGTRLDVEERNSLDALHRSVLKQNKVNPIFIQGDWASRELQAIQLVRELLEEKHRQFVLRIGA